MSYSGTRSANEAVLRVSNEDELAAWRRAKGKRVIQHRGRWWEEVKPGFYHAIHWMARQRHHQAEQPTALCWGFRTTLHEEDAHLANGWLPAHILTDPATYDFDTLPRKVRNKLRKCGKFNEIVQVTGPELLREQGYEVRCSVTDRLRIWKPPPKREYLAGLDSYIGNPYLFVLAGLAGDKLGGYLEGRAVDGTAYIDHVYVHSSALFTEVSTGLVFEFVQACRRSGMIREVVYGLDLRSDEGLTHYKLKMGFPVVRVPARYWLFPLTGTFMHWWRPEVYYRITGDGGLCYGHLASKLVG
jgi:hypothetical protein